MSVFAVIIAGGNGERLWPISTPRRPKQFVSLFEGKPLIQHAVDRLEGLFSPEHIIVITAQRFVAMTRNVLPNIPKCNIIGEPCLRDTAAAVAVGCGVVKKLGGDEAVGCILTADQLISPKEVFRKSLEDAIKVAQKNASIVTMGVVPNYPATGFGYVQCGQKIDVGTKTEFFKVKRFVEKPSLQTAQKYLRDGGFYWNSGMFIWRVDVLESAFASVAADIGELINKVVRAKSIASVLRKIYPTMRAISFDYGVMEKIDNILVAKSEFLWDDVGSWIALENQFSKDNKNNVCLGKTLLYEVSDTVVVGEAPNHLIAMIGVKDIVVVHTKEATLVCAKEHVQDIKKLLLQKKINEK